ncbi:MAG: alpha/beta fold hydrolase [Thermoleophilaceae bacterium]|nr:alpha/beta fold hydrolase [Thermoleophilaceae bacterium]
MPSHDLTLAHDRSGSGEPLTLVHPLGADRGVWKPVMDRLSSHHDVIAVDMPGFGESPELPADVPATAHGIAAEIWATLDSLGVGRAHVAGISLGGWVALELAKSDRCLSVTALCPAGFWARPLGPRPEAARGAARALVGLLRPLLQTERGRRLMLRGAIGHPERVPPADAYRLVRAYAVSPGFARANAEMRKTLFSGFDDIRVPITLAWADRDRLVSPPRSVPQGVHTVRLRDCGHVPTWDSPDQVVAAIRQTAARAARPVSSGA